MKIVKLDKRHNAFHEGFTHALRHDRYNVDVHKVEQCLRDQYGHEGFERKCAKVWYGYFGPMTRYISENSKTYWIVFRNESDITMLFLKGIIDVNNKQL